MRRLFMNFLLFFPSADDHSRVKLCKTVGQKKESDYINANFIDGYRQSRAFIGTQGPLTNTFEAFWLMIWQQRVAIIVMITNLVERGRRKCDMYWPREGTDLYGVIQVKLVKEEVMATYTVRTFQIRHTKLKKKKQFSTEKYVYQYQYQVWPDHLHCRSNLRYLKPHKPIPSPHYNIYFKTSFNRLLKKMKNLVIMNAKTYFK
jgi:protein tyrosine phosphatase